MQNKYVIEFLGTMVIVFAKLLTEAHPVIMGVVYFSVYWMTKGITSGYFSPFGPYAAFMLGRGNYEDMTKNFVSQFLGATAAIIVIKPVKAFIKE